MGSFAMALAANATGVRDAVGNQSSFAATAPADGASPVPMTTVLNNKTGGTLGKMENGDFFTVTYSEPLDVSSFCTTWSNDAANQGPTSVTASVANSASDPIVLPAPCAAFGTLTLNVSYVCARHTTRSRPAGLYLDVAKPDPPVVLGTPSTLLDPRLEHHAPTYTPTHSVVRYGGQPDDGDRLHRHRRQVLSRWMNP